MFMMMRGVEMSGQEDEDGDDDGDDDDDDDDDDNERGGNGWARGRRW